MISLKKLLNFEIKSVLYATPLRAVSSVGRAVGF
jgi:hypothetical protein